MLPSDFSDPERDILFNEAVNYILDINKASATLFQRHFKIGFARAMSLMDELENAGIIGPINGAKPRLILINSKADLGSIKPPKRTIEEVASQLQWKKTVDSPKKFIIDLGTDEKGNKVSIDLEKYGNLIIVGSQMTGVPILINQIIAQKAKDYSPNDLRLIVIDGFINQIDLPTLSPHLLTPSVRQWDRVNATLKWLQGEIENRLQQDNLQDQPKILVVINGYNELIFGLSESEYALDRLLTRGKSVNIYTVITIDYLASNFNKNILANNGAKVVFRPTTRQMARSSGVFESINLSSPDEAILETMYEGKTKFVIDQLPIVKIYKEIYK